MSSRDERPVCPHDPQAAPYVLGALVTGEAADYEEHLASCDSCREQVALLQGAADTLALSATSMRAPRETIERVMSVVRHEARILAAAGPEADRPAPRRTRVRWRLAAAVVTAGALAAAAVAALTLTAAPPAERVIAASVTLRGAHAQLRESGARGELVVSGMPQPPRGKVYELWRAAAGGRPQPTDALFTVSRTGSASVGVPGSLRGVHQIMVTAEPRGGSSQPTSAPVIVATLGSS